MTALLFDSHKRKGTLVSKPEEFVQLQARMFASLHPKVEVVVKALEWWAINREWFPTPSEIRDVIHGAPLSDDDVAMLAVGDAIKNLRSMASDGIIPNVIFEDPAINVAMEMVGYNELCAALAGGNETTLSVMWGRLEKAYHGAARGLKRGIVKSPSRLKSDADHPPRIIGGNFMELSASKTKMIENGDRHA